jgi:hypothetical protein
MNLKILTVPPASKHLGLMYGYQRMPIRLTPTFRVA